MMVESMPLGQLLLLAISALPLTLAGSCPYVSGNHARDNAPQYHSESILKPRYSPDGPGFGQCPRKPNVAGGGTRSKDWWPCELSLDVLRQNTDKINPLGGNFDYATEFANLDGKSSLSCSARTLYVGANMDTND